MAEQSLRYKTDLEYLVDAVELVSRKGRLYQAEGEDVSEGAVVLGKPCAFGTGDRSLEFLALESNCCLLEFNYV